MLKTLINNKILLDISDGQQIKEIIREESLVFR